MHPLFQRRSVSVIRVTPSLNIICRSIFEYRSISVYLIKSLCSNFCNGYMLPKRMIYTVTNRLYIDGLMSVSVSRDNSLGICLFELEPRTASRAAGSLSVADRRAGSSGGGGGG